MKRNRVLAVTAIVLLVLILASAAGCEYALNREDPADTFGRETEQATDGSEETETGAASETGQPENSKEPGFEIRFFDVGEGDSALVSCDGEYMLIDGGEPNRSSFLYAYLEEHGIDRLKYVVCTHAHSDHVGGLAGALNYVKVGTAYAPVADYDSRSFQSYIKYLRKQDKDITLPYPGEKITLGSAEVTFLGPVDLSLAEENVNNSSIVLRIVYGRTSFMFTGDAEKEEELSLLSAGAEMKSTLLKVGHHGSYTSSSDEFLEAVLPEYAVISVGKDNDFEHPHDVVMKRLAKYCSSIHRTDLEGDILCRSDGEKLSFGEED